jgi:hypothetical protein
MATQLNRRRLTVSVFWCLLAGFALIATPLACGGGDSDSGGRTGIGDGGDLDYFPSDDDDDSDDDFFPDDDDDDDDHWPDDDDDDGYIELVFFPDPEQSEELFFPGAAFAMELRVYDGNGFIGTTTDYELDIEPDTTGAVEYDTVEGSIYFNRSGSFTVAAISPATRRRSNEIEIFITDLEDAEIEIYTPGRGLFTQQRAVNISGRCLVEDEACAAVLVGGETPDAYDTLTGEFNIEYSLRYGLNIIPVQAFNAGVYKIGKEHISVLYGEALASDQFSNDAVAIRLTHSGLNSIEDIAEEIIQDLDIPELLADFGEQEIYDGLLSNANLEITGLTLGAPTVVLEMVGEELTLDVVLPDVHVDIFLSGDVFGIDWTDTGFIETNIGLMAKVTVGVTPDGKLNVAIVDMTTSVDELNIEELMGILGDILGFIDDLLFNSLSDVLSGFIGLIGPTLLQEPLEEALAEQLNELDLSTDFEFQDHTYALAAEFNYANIDQQGLILRLKALITADQYDPSIPEHPGSFKKPGDVPDMDDQYIPGTSTPYNMGVAINDDILNQAMYVIYRSGVLNFEFEDDSILNTQILGIFFPGFWAIHSDAPVIIRLRPLLQPVLFLAETDNLTTKVQLGEFMMDFVVDHPDDGEILAFTAVMAMDLPAQIDIDNQGRITLEFDQDDIDVEMSILDTDYDFSGSFIEGFVPTLVQLMLPLLGNLLGAIEIPTFSGYAIEVDALRNLGDSHDFMGVYGDIVSEG